jgi:hypothetical protein
MDRRVDNNNATPSPTPQSTPERPVVTDRVEVTGSVVSRRPTDHSGIGTPLTGPTLESTRTPKD